MSQDTNQLFREALAARASALKTNFNVTAGGEPVFEGKELTETSNPIARLLRLIFLDKNITEKMLHDAHFESERATGKLLRDINTSRNNMLKALSKERMTVQQFERILDVLKLRILDLSYTIQDVNTGEIKTYSLSDVPKYLQEHNIAQSDHVHVDNKLDDDDNL